MVEVSRAGASAFRVTGMRRVGLALVPTVMAVLLRVLGATLRYETIVEPGGFEQRKDSAPGIYCFWHRSLLGAAHYFRNWRIAILISRSYDGELIARTVEKLGFTAVRGSSSGEAAVRCWRRRSNFAQDRMWRSPRMGRAGRFIRRRRAQFDWRR